jgi:hypothetical protein
MTTIVLVAFGAAYAIGFAVVFLNTILECEGWLQKVSMTFWITLITLIMFGGALYERLH